MSAEPALLLVDDEPRILSALRRSLRREPCEVLTAGSADAALDCLARREAEGRPVRLVISDQQMPGRSGLDFLAEVTRRHPGTRCIVLTGWPEEIPESERRRLGLAGLFSKPWDERELKAAIRHHLHS